MRNHSELKQGLVGQLSLASLLAVLAVSAVPAYAGPKSGRPPVAKSEATTPAAKPAEALFGRLKTLAGTWTWQQEGKTTNALQTRVSAAGSAVIETMFPGEPHEMTNIYTLDGDKVVVTHYCASGNQPRMQASGESKPGVAAFVLRDALAVDAATGDYMGGLTVTLPDADHLVQEWQHFEAGKPAGAAKRFELTRAK
jgi:hypothetical protein